MKFQFHTWCSEAPDAFFVCCLQDTHLVPMQWSHCISISPVVRPVGNEIMWLHASGNFCTSWNILNFIFLESEVVIANHSDKGRFMERQCYTSFLIPLEAKFFSLCIFSSWGLTLAYRVIQQLCRGGLAAFPIGLIFCNFQETMGLIQMDLQDLSTVWFVFPDELRQHLADKNLPRRINVSING